jgi:putative ABC transport system permease protein
MRRTLQRKLVRELWGHRVQVASIALVMGCGIMTVMGLRSTLTAIERARDQYFDRYRLADVFASLTRAPASVGAALRAIPGVAAVETRIVRDVKLDVPGLQEPAIGHVVSIPDVRRPMLNELHLRAGRWIAARREDEVIVSEGFAAANGLSPGDSVAAVINGRWRRLRIVGIGISPEFVVEFGAGLFTDRRRYGVLWASPALLESAFDMTGAFNDVAVRLAPNASERAVIVRVDDVLRPWGGIGAYGRVDQPAARALEDEFTQLRANASLFPLFFLFVAAYLLNVILSRLVASQRDEIAALKAFGYDNREIGAHYLGFGLATVIIGSLAGIPLGMWMGVRFTALYAEYFRFPVMPSAVDWGSAGIAIALSGGFALLGALGGVRRVMRLPPAEALRPETPTGVRPLLVERIGMGRWVSPAWRMVLRNLERRPLRTAATVLGISLAVALLSSGRFPYDAFERLMDVEFRLAQRYDAVAAFAGERDVAAALDLVHLAGVARAEPFRIASARVRHGTLMRTVPLTGLGDPSRLYHLVDVDGAEYPVPAAGAAITLGLSRLLEAGPGDTITVEMLERGGEPRALVIAGVVDPMIGQGLYLSRRTLNALLREGDLASGAYLEFDRGAEAAAFEAIKRAPLVVGAVSRAATIRNIDEQMRESMVFILALIISSACIIAIGVVYNSARITLSERGRELASLRVLGFTTNEVSGMLLGEQLAMLLLAIPAGLAIGAAFSAVLVAAFETERFHFPLVFTVRSQVFAAAVTLAAAALAGIVIRGRVRRLNLVTALRTRE